MNFTCPKCGCHYEADEPLCPACNFEVKKYTVQAEPSKQEKKKEFGKGLASAVVAFVIVGAFVLLLAFSCGVDVGILGKTILMLLFPFYPLWWLI